MAIEKMELVDIAGLLPDLDKVLLQCCRSECFHIENSVHTTDSSHPLSRLNEENPYSSILSKLYTLESELAIKYKRKDITEEDLISVEELEDYVTSIEESSRELRTKDKELSEIIKTKDQALIQLRHLEGLKVDFNKIFGLKRIKVRFGKLPCDSYTKLSYYDKKTFFFIPFDNDGEYYWGVYFAPAVKIAVIDDIFNSLYYERIRIPEFVKGTPDTAIHDITEQLVNERKELSSIKESINNIATKNFEKLNDVFNKVKYLHDMFEYRKYAAIVNNKFYLVGFVPSRDAGRFMDLFEDLNTVSVIINPADADLRLQPPIKLRNNKFSSPFAMFVDMYGLPAYNGINPTNFVAITYTIMFGVMFGDLGQGLCISLIGFLLYKLKKLELGRILQRVGISSACFGFLFGSFFGFEEALDPIYKMIGLKGKPIHVFGDTNLILGAAIGIGATIIISSVIMNIYVGFKQKNYESAIFSNNGIAGLIFYTSLLFAGVSTLLLGKNMFTPLYIICLLVIPVILMFFREPLGHIVQGKKVEFENGFGDYLISNFFEVFEFFLGYATNTLSFVRVGGFVLSHAGMMSVVMLLAEMAGSGASPVVIIIGNLFVMGFEGLLVGIQVLRLEFYEIFSRFYDGDGKAFSPMGIKFTVEDN